MSIDARIAAVTRVLPGNCEHCGNTGQDPRDAWDDCPKCYGVSASGNVALRLHLESRVPGAAAPGQAVLTVVNPPVDDVSGLVGTCIWGGSSEIMIGNKKWARRIGYTRIELL